MDVCLQRSKQFNQIPVAYLICNSSPPVSDTQPALMTFREVETLFHEFGEEPCVFVCLHGFVSVFMSVFGCNMISMLLL